MQLFVPHIWPLEERNEQALRLYEDGLRGSDLRIHVKQELGQEPFID